MMSPYDASLRVSSQQGASTSLAQSEEVEVTESCVFSGNGLSYLTSPEVAVSSEPLDKMRIAET